MKLLKKITCALLTVILLNASLPMTVFAAEESNVEVLEATVTVCEVPIFEGASPRSTTFIDTSIDVFFETDGMHIAIYTGTNLTSSVIGVKDIKIQKKGLFGIWTTVATATGGEAYNVSMVAVSLVFGGAVEGETYRVCCTHYGNVDEYRELYHETSGITCAY
ncbi:MAG: hypothetical protein IKV27_04665 [Lachnospiraceae bacterium]|nr:hypothetical protein [Lachnospiraceae bacterium]